MAASWRERRALVGALAVRELSCRPLGDVVDLDVEARPGSGGAAQLEQILRQLPQVSGEWGSGRLLAGTAFSAVLTDDGRLAVGSVTPEVLYAALKK